MGEIFHGGNSTFINSFDKTKFLTKKVALKFINLLQQPVKLYIKLVLHRYNTFRSSIDLLFLRDLHEEVKES